MKNFKTFLAAMLLLLLGTTLPMHAVSGYVKVQIITKHENGGSPESTASVNNGNKKWVGASTFNIAIQPAVISGSRYKEHLIGIYRDAACTQLFITGAPTNTNAMVGWNLPVDLTQIEEGIVHLYSTSAEADSADPDVLYALFGYPKVKLTEVDPIIITEPYGTGIGSARFNVDNTIFLTDFRYSWGRGGNASYGYVKEEIKEASPAQQLANNVITYSVQYTAKNIHTGLSAYVGCATLRARDWNSNILGEGAVYIYVDLQPKFTLNTTAMDWSHDGVTEVNTPVGSEAKASRRSWLRNKLIIQPGTESNMARKYATWTATITGTNADQFKFVSTGTQSISASAGGYTDDLLDVIYAPTAVGTHSATLHIETSYTDSRNTHLTDSKDIPLTGKATAQTKLEFSAADHLVASTNESYDFGDIIGTNPREVTADLLLSQISDATKTWSDPDHAFEFDINDVDLTKPFQTLTFRAHRTTPVTEPTEHTATLTISGTGAEGPLSGVLTLTYRALPLLTPIVTWNWESLDENSVTENPITTNSDGVWNLVKAAGDKVIYDEVNKRATTPWLHHEPNLTAAFALSIPQTDSYAAFVGDYEANIRVTPPTAIAINSQETFGQYNIASYTGTYNAELNAIHLSSTQTAQFRWSGQNLLEFDLAAASTNNVYIIEYDSNGNLTKTVLAAHLSAGHHKFLISPAAYSVKIYQSYSSTMKAMDLCNLRYCEYDTIDTRYTQVPLVKDGDAISSLNIPVTFANKQQVTVSLNATAAQYFELSSAGKETGASIVFNESDGLAIRDTIMKTITVSFKAGANAEEAQQAALGNGCTITFSDSYTYNHEEHTLPILVLSPADVTYKHSANGSYTVSYLNVEPQVVSGEDFVKHIISGDPSAYVVTLSAPTPASGYLFRGWKIDGTIVTYKSTLATSIGKTCEVEAVFVPVEEQNFLVGDAYFGDLAAALAAAERVADDSIVTVMRDVTLGDGATPITYTVPAHVTLLVPHKADFHELQLTPELVVNTQQVLSAYRTLTLTEGVTINCNGNICVAAKMLTAGGGNKSAYPTGEVGVINMTNGGHIELSEGANLYCWGYIKGQDMDQGNNTQGTGTVTANAGSVVWENFELGDWRGGSASMDIYTNNVVDHRKLFPFQSYAIQNVEVPTSFKYGSVLRNYTSITTGLGNHGAVFSMIGSDQTMFLLQDEASLVRTWYDPTTDLTCYELSGTAQLDALHITVYVEMSSEEFILPISNSMHIILSNCNMTLSKPLMQQAGSIIEIKPSATVNLENELYLYDKDQWGLYVHNYYFRSFNNLTSHKNRGAENSKDGLDDAKLIVDGIFNIQNGGKLYTTAGGADVMGNHGGQIRFMQTLPAPSILWAVTVSGQKPYINWEYNDVAAANLHNEDGSYTRSLTGASFYNVHGRWFEEEDKEALENHTYAFTYMIDDDPEHDPVVNAVYSHDKTGLEERMKWFNVEEDGSCDSWWTGTNPEAYYNYTMLSDWHQFIETETENVYSGSNNVLYRKADCDWAEEGYIDENCLYTIGGVKKALVDGHFIPLTSNGYDPAYHNGDQYYICFTGCNWHPATPYVGESKAYTIHPEDEDLHYIWINNDWLNVLRDEPFFYTEDEITNVRTYYEYVNGEWEIATPYVSVTDAAETRTFYMIKEAFNVAQIKKNATITLLRDLPNVPEKLTYETQNTTCTLDLNGHLLGGALANLITINAPGATFTITDNTALKLGKISSTANKAVYVQKGALVVENGTIETTSTTAIDGAASTTIAINGGYFAANTKCVQTAGTCAISGGHFTKDANLVAYAAAGKYPFETTDPKYKYEVSDAWTIIFKNEETTLQTLHLKPGEMPVYTADQPTKDNHKFTGWDPAIAAATADATYQAQFEAIAEGSKCVTFNSNGGNEGLQYVYVASGAAVGTLPTATKDGHTFAGWFTAASGGNQINEETTISANVTYYAHYTVNQYTLTWDANGGQLSGSYTSGSVQYGAAVTAPTATFEGHTFLGWNVTPATTMPAHDVTYTAQWSIAVKHYLQNIDGTYPETPEDTENAIGGAGEYVTPAVKTYDGFITPATRTVQIGTATEVSYNYSRRVYTITLNANGGECATTSLSVKHGATPSLPVATKGGAPCSGWFTKAIGGDQITNETAILYNIGTLYAQYADLNVTAPLTVSDTREVSDLRITTTGSLTINGSVTTNNFILESNGSTASGQLLPGTGTLTIAGNAYFDLKVNAKNHQWYAVAVPWQVDATNGISVNGRTLILGSDFDVIYYDGARRAEQGKQKCWKYVENDGDKTLQPGTLYMIGLMSDASSIRFTKKSGAALLTTNTSVTAHNGAAASADHGWNGVANPALFHAFVNPGVTEGQVYVPDQKRYETVTLNTTKFVVGEGAFVQVESDKNITVVKDGAFAAPRRTQAQANLTYDVRIAPAEGAYTDRLFIKTTDNREADFYTVGQDLAKVGVSSIVPQMWINRYDAKLCVNTQELANETADYPLGISIPQAGEYTISQEATAQADNNSLYLTYNGEVIWNLTNGAYTASLPQGDVMGYGLRIIAKTPSVATGVDEALIDAQGNTQKVLIDNKVYIIRGNNVYSADGQLVK